MTTEPTLKRCVIWIDCRGVAATEFALVLPLLLLIMINVVSFFDGFRGNWTITRTNAVLVDLVTRTQGAIDDDDFDEVVAVGTALAGKYADDSNFTVVVSSVRNTFDVANNTDPELVWSRSNDDTKVLTQSEIDAMTLPTLAEADSIILVQVEAEYTPIIINELLGTFTLSDFLVRRPRFVTEVLCESDNDKC